MTRDIRQSIKLRKQLSGIGPSQYGESYQWVLLPKIYPTRLEIPSRRARPNIAHHRQFNPRLSPLDTFWLVAFDHFCQTDVRRANAELAKQKDEPLEISRHRVDVYQQASIGMLNVKVAHSLVIEIPNAIGVFRMFEKLLYPQPLHRLRDVPGKAID